MFSFAYALAYIFSGTSKDSNMILLLSIFISIVIIQFQLPLSSIFGLFLIWIAFGYQLVKVSINFKEQEIKTAHIKNYC